MCFGAAPFGSHSLGLVLGVTSKKTRQEVHSFTTHQPQTPPHKTLWKGLHEDGLKYCVIFIP